MRHPFGNAIAFLNQPAPFGVLLKGVEPVVQVFVPIATVRLRVHVIGDNHDRRAILHRVVHVGAGDRPTNATKARKRNLAGGLRVSIGHGHSLIFGNTLNELNFGSVNDRVTQRSHARAVANEDEARARRSDLFRQQLTSGSRKTLPYGNRRISFVVRAVSLTAPIPQTDSLHHCRFSANHRRERFQRGLRSGETKACGRRFINKAAPRDLSFQIVLC